MARCWCCDFLWFARLLGLSSVEPTPPRFPSPPVLGWWLVHQPIWKIWSSKWVHLPQIFGVKMNKYLKPPPDVFCLIYRFVLASSFVEDLCQSWARKKSSECTQEICQNFYLQVLLLHCNPTSSEQKQIDKSSLGDDSRLSLHKFLYPDYLVCQLCLRDENHTESEVHSDNEIAVISGHPHLFFGNPS